MTTIDEIRDLLELESGDDVRSEGEDAAPDGDASHGLVSDQVSIDALAVQAREFLGLLDIGLDGLERCKRVDFEPRVIAVEVDPGTDVIGETRAVSVDVVLLDTRFTPGYVRWFSDHGERVARFSAGECEVYGIARAVPAPLRDPQGSLGSAPTLDVPPSGDIFGEDAVDPWLIDAFDLRRGSPSIVDRAAAGGLVHRLWAPPFGQAADVVNRLLAGTATPPTRVDAWARALAREAIDELTQTAVRAAGSLIDEIAGLAGVHAAAPAMVGPAVRSVARRRDDLESVLAILRAAGGGDALASLLALIDDVAAVHMTAAAAGVEHDDDAHLATVAWCEPDAWWGQHGG